MAKLYFYYAAMNAGKSTSLLQASHNYREGGMTTYLITAQFDNRAGQGRIASRIGIGEEADTFAPGEDLFAKLKAPLRTAAGTKDALSRRPSAAASPPSRQPNAPPPSQPADRA